jgi:hypothetical protein
MKTPTASHYLHGLLAPNGASDGDGWCVAEESNVDARGGETGACGGDGQVACGLCGAGEGGAWRVRQEACIRAARTYGIQHSAFSIQHDRATPLHAHGHESAMQPTGTFSATRDVHTTRTPPLLSYHEQREYHERRTHTTTHTRTRLHHTRPPTHQHTFVLRPSPHHAAPTHH